MPADFRPTLLLTGFEPFGRFAVNPSWHAVAAAAEHFAGRGVVARLLPVDYAPAHEHLLDALDTLRPHAVLCTGLAAGDYFRLELIARKPVQFDSLPGEPIHAGTWPWEQAEAALSAAGMPCRRSDDAGRYVCESTYWSLLEAYPSGEAAGPRGFLHVPAVSDEFPVERTAAGVLAVVVAYLDGMSGPTG